MIQLYESRNGSPNAREAEPPSTAHTALRLDRNEAHKKSLADMASSEKRQSGGQVETDFRVKKVKKKKSRARQAAKNQASGPETAVTRIRLWQ